MRGQPAMQNFHFWLEARKRTFLLQNVQQFWLTLAHSGSLLAGVSCSIWLYLWLTLAHSDFIWLFLAYSTSLWLPL